MTNKVGIFSYSKACGKTTTCVYLASAFALVGKKVLVVSQSGKISAPEVMEKFRWDISTSFDGDFSNYDYVLVDIDSAGDLDEPLQKLDSVIIPIEAEFYGLEDLNKTLAKIAAFDSLLIEGFLFTKCNSNSTSYELLENKLSEYFSQFIFESKIYRNYYLSLPEFSTHTVSGDFFHGGFMDYLKLANEIIDNES